MVDLFSILRLLHVVGSRRTSFLIQFAFYGQMFDFISVFTYLGQIKIEGRRKKVLMSKFGLLKCGTGYLLMAWQKLRK